MGLAETAAFGVFNTFAISYAGSQLGIPEDRILTGVLIASAGKIVMFPVFGMLSDRVGRRPMYMVGAAVVGLMAFPFFMLLNTGVTALVWLGLSFGFIFGNGLMFSVQATFFSELFGVRVRYSGVSLAYQLGGVLGGFVPFIATALLAVGGGEPWLVSAFLAALALLALLCTFLLTETFRADVAEGEEGGPRPQPVGTSGE
ncbi:MAG: MFS transporter [Rubrobacter sp.]